MKYEAVSWEGALIGPETLGKLSDENAIPGQKSGDFGFKTKVRDEIMEAWADAKAQWNLFKVRRDREDLKDRFGTSRTRQFWIQPLLALLGYDLENAAAVELAGKSFAISHRSAGRICPVHIVGFTESLDKKREGGKYSPHSLVQEYVNLSETLFALVTNGLQLRLLRDSSRLIKLSYLEFNLERIFEEELFSDFALLFRLLHASRWPREGEDAAECLLERYHQDSLINGEAIRDKLSDAVKAAIESWAEGLLNHPANADFRAAYKAGQWSARDLYDELLTLVYRVLFLLVIEERDLTHPDGAPRDLREIYRNYYSLNSLRARCRSIRREEGRFTDLWRTALDCFSLYEDGERAEKLGLKPLAGDLFSRESFALLRGLSMDNLHFSDGLKLFDSYEDEKRGVIVRVNYAALNVEEFGSIYEGLLEFDAEVTESGGRWSFVFTHGADRGKSGSHYTPEELVQPLIEHALEPLIEKCLAEPDAEAKLLDLKVCDDACGSGHILLNAARRIALELARLRTGADNPDPTSYRHALRETIERCIYGVDSNPQAVRLCKVALWLESHNPGESLGFLDHHIKCGDSLVGLARPDDLLEPIPEAAFAQRDGDDKDYAAELRKRHKKEIAEAEASQTLLSWRTDVGESLATVVETLKTISSMDDATPEKAELKKALYLQVTRGESWRRLKALADIKLAPFFLPKRPDIALATEIQYRAFLNGKADLEEHPVAAEAERAAEKRRFFHWFLEFAEVMQSGGFDCFLGNPPFLGGTRISTSSGSRYLHFLMYTFAPVKAMDLVGYFIRRNFSLLKSSKSLGTLATNTIAQGRTREGCLDEIIKQGGQITMAVRSRKWPGTAAVEVSLITIYKGKWEGLITLDGHSVSYISTYLDDQNDTRKPFQLLENANKSFQGTYIHGEGFLLSPAEAADLIKQNPNYASVVLPYLNGEDLNSRPDLQASRWVINFRDWPKDRDSAPANYVGATASDYPLCLAILEKKVKAERLSKSRDIAAYPWWQHWRPRLEMYRLISSFKKVLVISRTTKPVAFTMVDPEQVLSSNLTILVHDGYSYLAICSSSFHYFWAYKNSTTLESRLIYQPSDIYETFAFPKLIPEFSTTLEKLGRELDSQRSDFMLKLDIGLTKLYNLYHDPALSAAAVVKEAKCPEADAAWAVEKIVVLRDLHRKIDEAVRDAYGWTDLPLQHDFHELEFLPENDRVRYTISNAARREILRSLLELNHARHAEEIAAGLVDKDGKVLKKVDALKTGGKKKTEGRGQQGLF